MWRSRALSSRIGDGTTALVIMTHAAGEAAMRAALVDVAAIDTVIDVGTFPRVTG